MPVGGIKEKVLAAHLAGIKTVMLPKRNQKDFEDIPRSARAALSFLWIERVEEALEHALEGEPTAAPALSRQRSERLSASPKDE
jgi:ATP-dependent Lon protease